MIFYFTGTGNSGFIAEQIGEALNEEITSISNLTKNNENLQFTLKDDESLGFIFPVYAWGPPKAVVNFIREAKFKNVNSNYIYSIATCGANIGNTMNIIKKELKNKGLNLESGFSIIMPNNYIIMGDVDSKEIENKKLADAKEKVLEIAKTVNNKSKGIFELEKGFFGPVLTALVHPMFSKNATNTSQFHVTDKCTGCGKCEKVCTSGTIRMENNKPVWGQDCNQCLACIHSCPVKALQYGKATQKKGRYLNPYFKL